MAESVILYPGARIGVLELLEPAGVTRRNRASNRTWLVRCHGHGPNCASPNGESFEVPYARLYFKSAYSCGCVARPRAPLNPARDCAGRRHGRLLVRWWESGKGWNCLCACGREEYVRYTGWLDRVGRHACEGCEEQARAEALVPRLASGGAEPSLQTLPVPSTAPEGSSWWTVRVKSNARAFPAFECQVLGLNAGDARERFYRELDVRVPAEG